MHEGDVAPRTPGTSHRSVRIGPVRVHDVTVADVLALAGDAVRERRQVTLCYANAHTIRLAADDAQFAQDLARADLVFCDGFGVQLASSILGQRLRARLTPPAWLNQLVGVLEPTHARFFLVGDQPEVVSLAATVLETQYPPARVVGAHHGFFAPDGPDNERLLQAINASNASVLLLGMGMPLQERWLALNGPRLQTPILMAVGAMFRRITGIEPRPQSWVVDLGLEWLFRLGRHPIAMFDRYVVGIPRLAAIVAQQWLHNRRAGGRSSR
jgi:N-acetylglucosaminyldiphosphoundecaprenol N-acetyl-beta-D-mannosaminyltransferase